MAKSATSKRAVLEVCATRLRRLLEEWVIRVALWSGRVERGLIGRVERGVEAEAFRQVRVCEEGNTERDGVGLAGRQNQVGSGERELFVGDITAAKSLLQLVEQVAVGAMDFDPWFA